FTISVHIVHENGISADSTSSATIGDAQLQAHGMNIGGTEGASTGTVTVATFTDLGGAEDAHNYSATINWGGAGTGSTTGTIVPNGEGGFSVQSFPTRRSSDLFTISVHIVHENGISADTTSSATI